LSLVNLSSKYRGLINCYNSIGEVELPIRIGKSTDEYIETDSANQRFTINMTKILLDKGTASKFLALDASKEITYVDADNFSHFKAGTNGTLADIYNYLAETGVAYKGIDFINGNGIVITSSSLGNGCMGVTIGSVWKRSGTVISPATDDDTLRIGDGTNYTEIQDDGDIIFAGTNKRHLSMRPAFVAGKTTNPQKPTPVFVGVWGGYSMPIYNSDNEELFWRMSVPGRWDGASDITYTLVVALSGAEDIGDSFKMQLSWNHTNGTTGAITTTSVQDLTAIGGVSSGHTAQYSVFKLTFTIDWDIDTTDIAVSDVLAGRVRRLAADEVDIAGEVIVLDHWLTFQVDRVFKA